MTIQQKLAYFQSNHFSEWLKTRQLVENELSDGNPLICVCGRLATGFHESGCTKFQNKVTTETVKKLSELLKVK